MSSDHVHARRYANDSVRTKQFLELYSSSREPTEGRRKDYSIFSIHGQEITVVTLRFRYGQLFVFITFLRVVLTDPTKLCSQNTDVNQVVE